MMPASVKRPALSPRLQTDWIEYGLPAQMLGRVASRASLAYAGVILDAAAPEDLMTDRLVADIAYWRAFGTAQPDKTGPDEGCHAD